MEPPLYSAPPPTPRSAPLINIREFRVIAKELLQEDGLSPALDVPVDISTDEVKRVTPYERIEDAIQTALKGMEGVEDVSAVQRACQAVEMPTFSSLSAMPDLQTLRSQRASNDPHALDTSAKRSRDANREANYVYNSVMFPQKAADTVPKPFEAVDPDEVVLSVAFYHPIKRVKTQPLTALKDAFYCLSDRTNSLKKNADLTAADVFDGPQYHSGYFFLENTFYNDMRDPSNVDYSKPMIAHSLEQGIPHLYSAKKMDEVLFGDLSIRLGVQYLYMHQGNCEHIVVFNEVRMLHGDDAKDKNVYPVLAFQSKIRRRKCRLCDIYPAKWVTYNDKLSIENPCFYCDHCYHPFHYSAEGKLLYNDFTVFPYFHEYN